MTKNEFYKWAVDSNIILEDYHIYPTYVIPLGFCAGCYRDEKGDWYYYCNLDWEEEGRYGRSFGDKMTEEECFEKLKKETLYRIEQKNKSNESEEKYQASLSEEERRNRIEYLKKQELMRLFYLVNQGVESVENVIIDIDKIYHFMDISDDNDEVFKKAKLL